MARTFKDRNKVGTALGKGPALPPGSDVVSAFCQNVERVFKIGEDVSDVTDRFFEFVENNAQLLAEYRDLESVLGRHRLNIMIGRWIKDYYGLENIKFVPAKRSSLIQAYTSHRRV
jgi:hypothetical protein